MYNLASSSESYIFSSASKGEKTWSSDADTDVVTYDNPEVASSNFYLVPAPDLGTLRSKPRNATLSEPQSMKPKQDQGRLFVNPGYCIPMDHNPTTKNSVADVSHAPVPVRVRPQRLRGLWLGIIIAILLAGAALAIAVVGLVKPNNSGSSNNAPSVGASSSERDLAALKQEVAWLQSNYTNLVNRKWPFPAVLSSLV